VRARRLGRGSLSGHIARFETGVSRPAEDDDDDDAASCLVWVGIAIAN